MLKYLDDPYYSTFVARYTDDALYFSEPQGRGISQELEFTFLNDQRVPFAQIDKFEIASEDKLNVIFTMKSDGENFDLVLETALSNKKDLQCLIRTWQANLDVAKFQLIAEATNDPRIKFMRDITIDPMSTEIMDEVDELAGGWHRMSYSFRKSLNGLRVFEIVEFMDSNYEKLTVIGDARVMVTYSFPTLAFYNNMFHRIMGGHLAADFESDLVKANSSFLENNLEKPDLFDELVSKTRDLLNHPRAKTTLRDLRFRVPNS